MNKHWVSHDVLNKTLWCALLVAALTPALCDGQLSWNLTTADFHTSAVLLKKIDADGLSCASVNGDDVKVNWADFLELSRPPASGSPVQPAQNAFVLQLRGGDRWNGQPLGIVGQQLRWKSPILGECAASLSAVTGLARPGKTLTAGNTDDVVILANGDTVHGILSELSADQVVIQVENAPTTLPLASVGSITLATAAGKPAKPSTGLRLRFDDGESAVVTAASLDGETLQFTLGSGAALKQNIGSVLTIEQVNGPVSWLSMRQPSENVYVAFFGTRQTWPAQMDLSVAGEPLRFKDQLFSHGVGVHAYSKLSWPLDGSFAAFRTRFAIDGDGPDADRADVVVRVKLDGKTVFEQNHVRAGVLSPVILQDISHAKQLTLEVDFGDRMDTMARLNWLETALLRKMPTATTSTAPSAQ